MRQDRLIRFCELKAEIKKLSEELEELREEIVAAYPADTEFRLPNHTIKIVYQEKKQFNAPLLFEAVPEPELWKAVFRADPAKIAALLKAGVLTENRLEGTYETVKTPYIYVHP